MSDCDALIASDGYCSQADSLWLTHKQWKENFNQDDRGCVDLLGLWCPHQCFKACLLVKFLGVVWAKNVVKQGYTPYL